MKHGYVRAAALTPVIRVADCEYNTQQVLEGMKEAFIFTGSINKRCVRGLGKADCIIEGNAGHGQCSRTSVYLCGKTLQCGGSFLWRKIVGACAKEVPAKLRRIL